VGADAVLMPEGELRRGVAVTTTVGPGGTRRATPTQLTFEGQAIRLLGDTCGQR
jgi:hypothetical protein